MIKQILYNCEADCTVLIRKPQVISGGVRTPCTLPLDPPLYVPLYEKRSNKPSSWACTFIGEIEQNTKEEKMIQCSAPYWEIENTIRFRADGLNFFPLVSFCFIFNHLMPAQPFVFSTCFMGPYLGQGPNSLYHLKISHKNIFKRIDLFTDTAAILNLLDLRSIMGCLGGTRSAYTRPFRAKRELQRIFLGKKAIVITFKDSTKIFFSHYKLFLGKLEEKLARKARVNTDASIWDRTHAPWASHNTP